MSELPPAGWYDDPEHATGLRYWDGATWTDHRHVPEGTGAAEVPGPADEAPAATEPAIDLESALETDGGAPEAETVGAPAPEADGEAALGTGPRQETSPPQDPAPFARPGSPATTADVAGTGWAHPDGGTSTTPSAPPAPPLPDQGGWRQQPASTPGSDAPTSADPTSAGPTTTAPSWQQPPQWRATPDRVSGKAAASLILSLAWLFGVGSVIAVVLGVLGRRDAASDPELGGSGMATAGIVLGVLGALFALLVLTALV